MFAFHPVSSIWLGFQINLRERPLLGKLAGDRNMVVDIVPKIRHVYVFLVTAGNPDQTILPKARFRLKDETRGLSSCRGPDCLERWR